LFKRGKDRKTGDTAIQPSKKIQKKSPPCNLCIPHDLKIEPFLVPEKLHLEVAPRSYFASQCKSGWWYTYPSEEYECVSWDDDIPNIWKNKNVPNHQPEVILRGDLPTKRCYKVATSCATGTSEIQVLVGKGKPNHRSIQLNSATVALKPLS